MNITVDKSIVSLESQAQHHARHLGWLDQIRGAAALYVVCHHAVMQITIVGDHAHDPLYRILQLLTSYGHYAVDIFIVLSGYCLMLPVVAKQQFGNIWTFYLRRTVRIVLPYYAAIVVTLILIYLWMGESNGSLWANSSLPVTIDSVWKHLLLIHQWFPEAALKINAAFWSVGVEYQIYFLFPLFYFLARNIGFTKSLVLVTLMSYSLWGVSFYLDSFNPGPNGTSVYYCSLFFMGMLAAQYANRDTGDSTTNWLLVIEQHSEKVTVAALAGIVVVAMVGFLAQRFTPAVFFPLQIQSLFVGLFVAVLLYLKGKNKIQRGNFNNSFILKRLEWVGTIGFSLYLLHDPVIAMVWSYVVVPMNLPFYWMQALVELVIGLIASLAVAMIFYKLVELPCHQLSKSITKR